MELKEGMYVRTKNGTIFKITGGNVDMWEIDVSYNRLSKHECEDYNSYAYNKNNDLFENIAEKTSFDIIDLIKEGDIIINESKNKLEVLLMNNELMVRNMGLIYDNNYYLPINTLAYVHVSSHATSHANISKGIVSSKKSKNFFYGTGFL